MAGAHDEGKSAIIIITVLTVLATFFVLVRLQRRKSRGFLGPDDWVILAALVVMYEQNFWAYTLATLFGKPYGELTFKQQKWYHKTYFFGSIGYLFHVTMIKIAILISYKRIFGHIRWTRHAIYVMGMMSILWLIGAFLSFVPQCTPIIKALEPWRPGHCRKMQKWLWATSISNMIMDWLILLLPIVPLVGIRSQLETTGRVLAVASFAFGSLACVATSARALLNTWDYHEYATRVFLAAIATYAEPMVAIISACLPFLYINHFFARSLNRIRHPFHGAKDSTNDVLELDFIRTKANNLEYSVVPTSRTTRVVSRLSTWLPPGLSPVTRGTEPLAEIPSGEEDDDEQQMRSGGPFSANRTPQLAPLPPVARRRDWRPWRGSGSG
ncbi:hypothetical protein K504DRAFT_50295 [Pleomassaria siparia CBS 279.74]|uniref:Rhodopsin domain-containing protein n=1 Tax=Pleomassaria siparia CBS 279.74 TaxID=1314801 RepID=A0A6G1K407_9PLEO|nr:hypothetical protein K504DRAFT_50295 [Pleomassaria siparia CBS 279.74]